MISITPIDKKLMKKISKPTVGELDTKPLNIKNNKPIVDKKYKNNLLLCLSKMYPNRNKM